MSAPHRLEWVERWPSRGGAASPSISMIAEAAVNSLGMREVWGVWEAAVSLYEMTKCAITMRSVSSEWESFEGLGWG